MAWRELDRVMSYNMHSVKLGREPNRLPGRELGLGLGLGKVLSAVIGPFLALIGMATTHGGKRPSRPESRSGHRRLLSTQALRAGNYFFFGGQGQGPEPG